MREDRRHDSASRLDVPSSDVRDDLRSSGARDRDRVLYCDPFRRLLGVTQVVGAHEGLTFHNRLTHSMKVGQTARRLSERLLHSDAPVRDKELIDNLGGLDPEVAEAAALAHDIGHPPFGHATERILDELVRGRGCHDGFEGNAQSFRIITTLAFTKTDPDNPPGLNLTRATLRAVLKYPWLRDLDSNKNPKEDSVYSKKWGAYLTESEDFDFAMQMEPSQDCQRSLEAEIMDWADDVTYAVHDLEDFYRAGLIPLPTLLRDRETSRSFLEEVCEKKALDIEQAQEVFQNIRAVLPSAPFSGTASDIGQLSVMRSRLITTLLKDFGFDDNGAVIIQSKAKVLAGILKHLTWKYVIEAPDLSAQQYGQRQIIIDLFDAYCDIDAKQNSNTRALHSPFFEREFYEDCHSARRTADFVASLTEDQAIRLHRRITGQALDSIRLPIA